MLGRRSELLAHLADRYFSECDPSVGQTSSHWKEQHARARLTQADGDFRLEGQGFGYDPNPTAKSLLLGWMTIALYLLKLPDRLALLRRLPAAVAVARRMGHPFTYNCFRSLCTYVSVLRERELSRVAIIGDGWGYLAGLIRHFEPRAAVFLIDLGKTLTFQVSLLGKAFPEAELHLVDEGGLNPAEVGEGAFVFCPAESVREMEAMRFDLFINVASMQEMTMPVIEEYFRFMRGTLRSGGLFYCCNRKEKVLPCGSVIRFHAYPWDAADIVLIDGPCPWHTFFLESCRAARGPVLFGRRVPYINWFDGDHLHRLAGLTSRSR
ncbi:MAG: putative sugar O-methyltransferase [Pseudodesulfovibrio sp.]